MSALVVLAVAVVAIVGLVWWARRRIDEAIEEIRVEARAEAERASAETRRREAALDKQAKVFVRKLERTRRQSDRMIDEAHSLHQTVNGVLSDPRVQRLLNEGKTRR